MGFSLKRMFSGSGWRKFKGIASIAVSAVPGVGGLAGKVLTSGIGKVGTKAYKLGHSTAMVLHASPVLPGGAVATSSGPKAPMVNPPASYGGGGGGGVTRRRKATTKKRRKAGTKRKLKFGSPAWRKKYMGKRRARR